MKVFIGWILGLLTTAVVGAIIFFVVMPRLSWTADAVPGPIESWAAHYVKSRWVRSNAPEEANPFKPTPANLAVGKQMYDKNCAYCHGIDGSGSNEFSANLYPPPARLIGGTQRMTDAEIYFVIAEGVRNTPMPSFKAHHSSADIWKTVLWVRHLAHLTPKEEAAIEQRQKQAIADHLATTAGASASQAPN